MIVDASTQRSLAGQTPAPPGGWLPLIVAGLIYAVVVCVVVVLRAGSTTDFRDFWNTGLHFRSSGQISSDLGVHNYLPFFAIFMAPWSYLPLKLAIVLFTLFSLGLLAMTVVLVEALLQGGLGPRPSKATWITLGLMLAYVHSGAVLGQVDLLLLFLIVASWFLLERGREWQAGLPLGLAALIKLLPATLIVFLLLKLRWRAAGSAAGVFLILGLGLPLASLGYEETIAQHAAFYQRAIKVHSAYTTINAQQPRKAMYNNNALPIVLRRVLSRVNADPSPQGTELYVNGVELPPGMIWGIYLALMGVFLIASVVSATRATRPWPPDRVESVEALRAQFGVWCCLMLIASPLVWTHYLVLAYWPLALVAHRADRTQQQTGHPCRRSIAGLLIWLVCVLLLAWPATRAVGAQLASVVCLWGVVLLSAFSGRKRG